MSISSIEGKSLLAIDIGAVNTRAAYFDVIEGGYRFIGMGQSPTTSNVPVHNAMIGVQLAIENLQSMVGKDLMDEEGRLIIPSQPDGLGVDSMVTSLSLGPAISTVLVGLLADVSLMSVENLAQTTYVRVVDSIKLNDTRRLEEQVDAIVRVNPELVLIAGGVDGGASKSIEKLLEIIGLGIYLLPEATRPVVLYAGNKGMAQDVQVSLNNIAAHVYLSPNIRPSLDVEDLIPAQRQLAKAVVDLRQRQMPELEEIRTLSGGRLVPSSFAQGRMTRFLSSYFGSGKCVLSIDVGASSVSISASFGGELHLNVFPQLGVGQSMANLLDHTSLDDIVRWIALDVSAETVRNYLYQKSLYPGYLPVSVEDLAIEQAVVRQNLMIATRWMLQRLPGRLRLRSGLLPSFEPILAGGAAITGAANAAQKLLMLLDGLQPVGITTIALDQNNLLSMLGAIAEANTILPVQAIDAGALLTLASVISPVSDVDDGKSVMHARLFRDDGSETTSEILMGSLHVLPLGTRQTARLQLRPVGRADVGLGPGRAGEVDVMGSSIGLVIDARGRPLRIPADSGLRRAMAQNWIKTLGG